MLLMETTSELLIIRTRQCCLFGRGVTLRYPETGNTDPGPESKTPGRGSIAGGIGIGRPFLRIGPFFLAAKISQSEIATKIPHSQIDPEIFPCGIVSEILTCVNRGAADAEKE
jgi:hypothetical protein